jgi:hypothetical protein
MDVDIHLPADQLSAYANCITNHYIYRVVDLDTLTLGPELQGTTYRCRVKGVVVRECKSKHARRSLNRALRETMCWIRRTSGYFNCEVSDVDTYNRLLIELFDPVTGQSLTEHMLKTYPWLFSAYPQYGLTK